ncbi:MAG: hypothetical protein AMJ90_00695 [candidate division Zixibacteria bacterium SM23_73_2]|nr:MAG: hypothetical protein AMJ90_00695 [candidate division Zixibacteria bacterium SM23_73_2]
MKDLRVTWFFLGLSIVVLILYTFAIGQTASDKEILQLFPNSRISWSKEIDANIVNYKASQKVIAISITNDGTKSLKFINFEKGFEWSINGNTYPQYLYYIVGEDKLSVIGLGERNLLETNIFNEKGEHLFRVKSKSGLYASPGGRYFHTKNNMDSYNDLEVYDSTGKLLWSRSVPPGDWHAEALSDSELIYVDNRGCFLINPFSEEEIWEIPSLLFRSVVAGGLDIEKSATGHFTLFDGKGIASVSQDGKLLWLKKSSENILSVSLSQNGRFIAVYSIGQGKNAKPNLTLLDNFNEGKMIWERELNTQKRDIRSSVGAVRIGSELVTVMPGAISYYFGEGITPDIRTFFFIIDPRTGEFRREYVLPGAVYSLKVKNKSKHFWLTASTDKKKIYIIDEGAME